MKDLCQKWKVKTIFFFEAPDIVWWLDWTRPPLFYDRSTPLLNAGPVPPARLLYTEFSKKDPWYILRHFQERCSGIYDFRLTFRARFIVH